MAPKMSPIPTGKYVALLAVVSAQALVGGYFAGTRPAGAGWRYFSVSLFHCFATLFTCTNSHHVDFVSITMKWHPFLMMCGECQQLSMIIV